MKKTFDVHPPVNLERACTDCESRVWFGDRPICTQHNKPATDEYFNCNAFTLSPLKRHTPSPYAPISKDGVNR